MPKLCSLSPKLCYLDCKKIKITSSLTLSILALMNVRIVHLPVLQSYNLKQRKYACAHLRKRQMTITFLPMRKVLNFEQAAANGGIELS